MKKMLAAAGVGLVSIACTSRAGESDFEYSIDEFADIEILRYQVPGWDSLSLRQKEYVYHLSEAAKSGRDITWDQNFKYNLAIRHVLENILENYRGERSGIDWENFLTYSKRVFFSNGIHHHYSNDKIMPSCTEDYFAALMKDTGCYDEALLDLIFNPDLYATKQYQGDEKDIVSASAVNFYEDGITAAEVNAFYEKMVNPKDTCPISYGLNSKVVRNGNTLKEEVWKVGGLYGEALSRIVGHLEDAALVAENDLQKKYIEELVEYYTTGDLRMWDRYNITWVGDTDSDVDFVNGFVEDYDDPLGRKASWEGIVNFRDRKASRRTETISRNAQWFEDHSPIDPRFRKKEVKGVSAKVINVAVIAGDNYPATAIGINLPNADWIRKDYGSKSVTIANITDAYACATEQRPKSVLTEFAWDEDEISLCRKYGTVTDNLHTDLHECLGHGSGQLLEGTPSNALKEYTSTLEEARADLFALYYLADPKLVELGLLDSPEAYKAEYMSYIRNGIFTQFSRIEPGKQNTEAHMQNRQLIAQWCFERGASANVIEKRVRDGKTYFVINDFDALRGLFGELLAEIQRIKSEGDYEAGKDIVCRYAINIDPELHREVLARYASLDLKPYRGFVNPDIVPVVKGGEVVDYKIVYCDDFLEQQLQYGRDYSTL
ncbi:MAG: dihydrofolate reductase [Bacteroidales bacterium]|nr:dihydrofolate reductase [Candidatus Cacconaster equifaecalis]